jgi:hypothetical protein
VQRSHICDGWYELKTWWERRLYSLRWDKPYYTLWTFGIELWKWNKIVWQENTDKFINNFGRNLLEFCKATGLRIENGRHVDDSIANATFVCSRGNSLRDYVLAECSDFDSITHFWSSKFNVFSDHSPICFKLSNV